MLTPTHITTSGGLISAAFIENVRQPGSRQRGSEPESFALPWTESPRSPAALEERIATAWELLLERWDAVRNDLPALDISQVRYRWLLPLFELLDFRPVYLRGDTILDEAGKLRFPLSHRGWNGEDAPVLHTVVPSQDLDGRMVTGRGIKTKSPHDMLQAFLNASPTDRWAILTNGILLRLLRDYHHTFTKGYVQFDLESMCETRNYGDFRALYRLCHASRFVPPLIPPPHAGGTEGGVMPLEQFYKDSIATGVKVGEDLRGQVRQAIEMLGNGFLTHHVSRFTNDPSRLVQHYYAEVLHVIYRILFLLFAEQRGMLPGRNSLYAQSYSIAALRARAEGDIPAEDDFTDLWEGLKVTFRMVRQGVPALGIFGYDGVLFAEDQTPLLDGLPSIRNSALLHAIRALTLVEREGVLQRISYADLGVEELGSIYESLLDYAPRVTTLPEEVEGRKIPANTFFLDPRGSERKTTGSYYTHPSLVNELLKSALLPVARERLAAAGLPVIEETAIGEATAGLLTDYAGLSAKQRAAGEKALLSLKVCDPAVGSGHFLVKANNALGAELARIRSGDEYPTEAEVQAAKRDVLAHCIYAVDLNPMAVELCRVSLWINASVADKPLSFLDHHIKCGNSLIGATPELMAAGIPHQAFDPQIVGNDRATANAVRRLNREEEAGQLPLGWQVTVIETHEDLKRWGRLSQLAEEQPQAARKRYAEYVATSDHRRRKLEADLWTAAFFWPLTSHKPGSAAALTDKPGFFPTHGEFQRLREEGPRALPPEALEQVEALAEQYRFFHWHLEFPDMFGTADDGRPPTGAEPPSSVRGRPSAVGFDVVLGNPPWERLQFEERTFFEHKRPEIYNEPSQATRRTKISELRATEPALYQAWATARRQVETEAHFLRSSGRFPFSAVDKFNLYAVFAELTRHLYGPKGRGGIIVKAGYITDELCSALFADTLASGDLLSATEFENRLKVFPDVDPRERFALITLGRDASQARFSFDNLSLEQLHESGRRIPMSYADVVLLSPNTKNCPKFSNVREFEITKRCYSTAPPLVRHEPAINDWKLAIDRYINVSDFSDEIMLVTEPHAGLPIGFDPDCALVPLYEGKLIHQYDHRYATYEYENGNTEVVELTDKSPEIAICFQRLIPSDTAMRRNPQLNHVSGLLAVRDITNRTNERGVIAAIIPPNITDYTVRVIRTDIGSLRILILLSTFNSFAFDYLARQRIGGTHLSNYILEQSPVPSPDRYTPELLDFIVPRVVELTYTAWNLQAFAQDILKEVELQTWARWFADAPVHTSPPPAWAKGATPAPFVWDEERRAHLRAELDGLYAHLYGLTREELDYILDTFPIVRRKDEKQWGEYRTKRMVLECYDELAGIEPLGG